MTKNVYEIGVVVDVVANWERDKRYDSMSMGCGSLGRKQVSPL
jgi:hypothetical protein